MTKRVNYKAQYEDLLKKIAEAETNALFWKNEVQIQSAISKETEIRIQQLIRTVEDYAKENEHLKSRLPIGTVATENDNLRRQIEFYQTEFQKDVRPSPFSIKLRFLWRFLWSKFES